MTEAVVVVAVAVLLSSIVMVIVRNPVDGPIMLGIGSGSLGIALLLIVVTAGPEIEGSVDPDEIPWAIVGVFGLVLMLLGVVFLAIAGLQFLYRTRHSDDHRRQSGPHGHEAT